MQSSPLPPNLRRAEAARYLREAHGLPCAPATLAKYACLGSGPRFRKAGTVPLYAIADLDAWARQRLGERRQAAHQVIGRQGHGGYPWRAVDPVTTAAQIVLGLQTVVSRRTDLMKSPTVLCDAPYRWEDAKA